MCVCIYIRRKRFQLLGFFVETKQITEERWILNRKLTSLGKSIFKYSSQHWLWFNQFISLLCYKACLVWLLANPLKPGVKAESILTQLANSGYLLEWHRTSSWNSSKWAGVNTAGSTGCSTDLTIRWTPWMGFTSQEKACTATDRCCHRPKLTNSRTKVCSSSTDTEFAIQQSIWQPRWQVHYRAELKSPV